MSRFKKDAEYALPTDFLIVTPYVNGYLLLYKLNTEIHNFYEYKFKNASWVEEMLRRRPEETKAIIDHFKNTCRRYCYLHQSVNSQPINTDLSKYSVRIVSIHSSQGDGRLIQYLIAPTEYKLKKFSGSKINDKYMGLLNVSISRAKEILRVFLEPYYDNIYIRFMSFIEMENSNDKTLPVLPWFAGKINLDKIDLELLDKNYALIKLEELNNRFEMEKLILTDMVEYDHHVLRYAIAEEQLDITLTHQQVKDGNKSSKDQLKAMFYTILNAKIKYLDSNFLYIYEQYKKWY